MGILNWEDRFEHDLYTQVSDRGLVLTYGNFEASLYHWIIELFTDA